MFGISSPLVFPSCLCSRFVLCSRVVGGKMGMESKSCVAGTTGFLLKSFAFLHYRMEILFTSAVHDSSLVKKLIS